MKGVKVIKAKVVNEDARRRLVEIQNGQIEAKNCKILEVKEDSFLGGHWHEYAECMYIMSGKVWDYKMKNMDTKEEETFELGAGDIVFRTARIMHGGWFSKGCIVIDLGGATYLDGNYNDIQEDITK